MTEEKKKTIFDRIWDVFASVKLAIVIFALIAVTSIVGTIIEQQAEPEKNIQVLVKMFGISHDSAHSVLGVLDSLGFTNMYHSWWFLAFLLLFAANLIICSLDRLPRIWKLVQEKIRPVPASYVEKMSIRQTVVVQGKTPGIRDSVAAALKSAGFKPAEAVEGASVQLYAEKGNYTRLGVYITHLSILIILAGAIIGIFFGFNAFLNLPEGETTSVAYKDRGIEVPLGFEIRCDNFEVEFYPNSEMPKSYKSELVILKNGQEVMKKTITVNDPLTYQGITFYQSSYGMVPNSMGKGVLILRAVPKDGKPEQLNLKFGSTFTIPGTTVTGTIRDFSPALSFDQGGNAFTFSDQMTNPAIYVDFADKGNRTFSGWILKRFPRTWELPDGNRVEFLDYWGVQYTGMQVRQDPGVLIVYLGCIIMAAGLYMTFFMSHRRVWVSLSEEKGSVKVLIGASANRNRASLERKIEKMVSAISTGHKGGK
ncbi:MAG TPA: cytochrome c biogenesis protein ResB [Thermodesulfovibrionales bacterium]|nr:cytochrome c biogenesis protein ResB [Thermodesulfovibrionales bacterium]